MYIFNTLIIKLISRRMTRYSRKLTRHLHINNDGDQSIHLYLFLWLRAIKNRRALANKFADGTEVGESSIIPQNARKMTGTFTASLNDADRNIRSRGTRMTRSIGYRFAYGFRRIRQIRRTEVEPRSRNTPSGFSTHVVTRRRFLRETRTGGRGAFAL